MVAMKAIPPKSDLEISLRSTVGCRLRSRPGGPCEVRNMRRRRKRSNGEGTVYPRSDGRWGATVLLADGSRGTVYARTERDALEKMRELVRARDKGMPVITSNQTT